MTIRVATWNLERCSPLAWRKAPAQQRRIDQVNADLWVLTETFTLRSPGPDFTGVFSPPHPERRRNPDERWTAVWSRWPIEQLDEPAPHRRGTVAARIATPAGPVIVYGTVIAYQHEPTHDDGRPARGWEVHMAEVTRQSAEWQLLRQQHPETPLIVAGDFNQARSGRPRSYGTTATRVAMTDALGQAGSDASPKSTSSSQDPSLSVRTSSTSASATDSPNPRYSPGIGSMTTAYRSRITPRWRWT